MRMRRRGCTCHRGCLSTPGRHPEQQAANVGVGEAQRSNTEKKSWMHPDAQQGFQKVHT